MLLKSWLCWAGHVSWIGNHHLPRITQCRKLSAGHCDKGVPKKQSKDCLKKTFGACNIDHYKLSTLAENCDAWHLTTNHIIFSLENTSRGRGTIILCHQALTKLSAVTTMTMAASPTLVLSVTNMPAGDMDWPLLDLHFTKSSQS